MLLARVVKSEVSETRSRPLAEGTTDDTESIDPKNGFPMHLSAHPLISSRSCTVAPTAVPVEEDGVALCHRL